MAPSNPHLGSITDTLNDVPGRAAHRDRQGLTTADRRCRAWRSMEQLSRWPEVLRVIGLNRGSSNPGGRPTRRRGHVVPSAGPTHHQRAGLAPCRNKHPARGAQSHYLTLTAVPASERLEASEIRLERRVGQAQRLEACASGRLVDRASVEGAWDDLPSHVQLEVVCRSAD
jgi:hypothetical protein